MSIKKVKRRSGVGDILAFIEANHGYQEFTTEWIYKHSSNFRIKESAIPGALTALKKKGYLINERRRLSENGNVIKTWKLVHEPIWC